MWYPDYNNGTKPRLDGFYYFMLHNTNWLLLLLLGVC
jgi:hypothetical protein